MKEITAELMRIIGSGAGKDTGKGRAETAMKAESGWSATLVQRIKVPRAKSAGSAGSWKASKPEEVIPFDKGDFKDF